VYDSKEGAVAALYPDELGAVTVFETSDPALAQGLPAAIAATADVVIVANGDRVVVHDLLGAAQSSWSAGGPVTGLAAIGGTRPLAAIVDGEVRLFDLDGTPRSTGEAAVATTTATTAAVPGTTAESVPFVASTVAPRTSVREADPVPTDEPAAVGTVPGAVTGTSRP
jgi:hypothetical protein